MNRKYVAALTLMMILAISLQSVIGIAIAKKPEKPPKPEPQNAEFKIWIGKAGDDLILLEETHTSDGKDYFHVVDPLEDYDYNTYATTDPRDIRHSWAHFDGGYGAEPIAFGIYHVNDLVLQELIDVSVKSHDGQGVIQMLWLWHQWGVNDGEAYDHWSINFWWYTMKDPYQEVMMSMKATTYDGFSYDETKEAWTILFDEIFTLEFSEWVLQSAGKSGKGRWVKVNEGIAWQGTLTFTVTVDKVSDPF
jgi:hypothetical protein